MWKLRKLKRGERGFTLIELMIVMAVVGILAAVVSTGVSGTTTEGKTTAKVQDVDLVQQAVDRYYSAMGDYPYLGSAPADAFITTGVTAAMIEEIDFMDDPGDIDDPYLVPTYLRENPNHTGDSVTLTAGTTYDLDGDGAASDPDDWTIGATAITLTSPWVMDQNGKVYCAIAAKKY